MSYLMLSNEGNELSIMITEACNSNCIMCPMGVGYRQRGNIITEEDLSSIADVLSDKVEHIDITGGEPFLHPEIVFRVMKLINDMCPTASVLVLTNGRALSLPSIQRQLLPLITDHYQFAIPIHGDTAELHDAITQAKGSYRQSIEGIRFLTTTKARIEIRIVGHKINAPHITQTIKNLCSLNIHIDVVHFIAMEMNGNAAFNRDKLWIDYDELFQYVQPATLVLLANGIDFALYQFPLCCIPRGYWPMAKKSISQWKVRFPSLCDSCNEKEACSGFFKSTYLLKLCKVMPITGG